MSDKQQHVSSGGVKTLPMTGNRTITIEGFSTMRPFVRFKYTSVDTDVRLDLSPIDARALASAILDAADHADANN